MEKISKEVYILRQQLSVKDETISQQRKEIEASEAAIKILKEKVHLVKDQLSSSGNERKEHANTREVIGLQPIRTGIVNIHVYIIICLFYGKNRDKIRLCIQLMIAFDCA